MGKKLTLEFVKKYFKDQECELLETEYKNSITKMKYCCKCGNKSEITYCNFKSGKRCQKCAGNEKLTYEFVKEKFKKENCELLETTYINARKKMKYKCSCTYKSEITWDQFQKGVRCIKCSGHEKLLYKDIFDYFNYQNCELLESLYINTETPMKYKCECGNISSISYSRFKNGQRCKTCGIDKLKLTNNFVYNFFKKEKCKLLEKYVGSGINMKYICKCGIESIITWNSFKSGSKCKNCGYERSEKSGKTHKNYTLPSGKIIRIQGYENIALDELVKQFNEEDIITNKRDMPKINYNFEDKQRRYYPDIWIKSINKIIEVKSTYTYNQHLEQNKLKEFATKKLNFDFEFWVYKLEKKTYSKEIIVN